MGQQEVINYLRKQKEPKSRSEIADGINGTAVKVSASLRKLIKYGEVKIKEIDRHIAMKKYNCQRRMRLYYI